MRTFTVVELATFNGIDGNPSYVAYNGKVYDLTDGPNWADGAHYMHSAGEDLTEEMEDSPHSDDVMEAFPIVGELVS